jgi:ribosomal protein S18 acetylase RimI-like enzyme
MTAHVAERDAMDSLCLAYTQDSLCYIYVLATDPDRQRNGAGRALLTSVMNGIADRGVDAFALLASSEGRPLYESMGYEVIDPAEFWILNRPPAE